MLKYTEHKTSSTCKICFWHFAWRHRSPYLLTLNSSLGKSLVFTPA